MGQKPFSECVKLLDDCNKRPISDTPDHIIEDEEPDPVLHPNKRRCLHNAAYMPLAIANSTTIGSGEEGQDIREAQAFSSITWLGISLPQDVSDAPGPMDETLSNVDVDVDDLEPIPESDIEAIESEVSGGGVLPDEDTVMQLFDTTESSTAAANEGDGDAQVQEDSPQEFSDDHFSLDRFRNHLGASNPRPSPNRRRQMLRHHHLSGWSWVSGREYFHSAQTDFGEGVSDDEEV